MQLQTNTQIISELIGNKRDSRCLYREEANGNSKTHKPIKSFGDEISDTQSSSVLKFEYPLKTLTMVQAETLVTISSRCGRTIKKNHYNDDDYYYPAKASIPVLKVVPK